MNTTKSKEWLPESEAPIIPTSHDCSFRKDEKKLLWPKNKDCLECHFQFHCTKHGNSSTLLYRELCVLLDALFLWISLWFNLWHFTVWLLHGRYILWIARIMTVRNICADDRSWWSLFTWLTLMCATVNVKYSLIAFHHCYLKLKLYWLQQREDILVTDCCIR